MYYFSEIWFDQIKTATQYDSIRFKFEQKGKLSLLKLRELFYWNFYFKITVSILSATTALKGLITFQSSTLDDFCCCWDWEVFEMGVKRRVKKVLMDAKFSTFFILTKFNIFLSGNTFHLRAKAAADKSRNWSRERERERDTGWGKSWLIGWSRLVALLIWLQTTNRVISLSFNRWTLTKQLRAVCD